jgi:hypothetical protein
MNRVSKNIFPTSLGKDFLLQSRNKLDAYQTRQLSIHKPGVIPESSRNISPISSNRHKYELKQQIWPKQTIESWFTKHSTDGILIFIF